MLNVAITRGFTMVAGTPLSVDDWNSAFLPNITLSGLVGTPDLSDGAVTTAKLAAGLVVASTQIALGNGKVFVGNASGVATEVSIDTATMASSSVVGVKALGVTAAELASNAVTTAKIIDKAVTLPKVGDIATNRILGRGTSGSGVIEELTVGAGLSIQSGALLSTLTGVQRSSPQTVSLAGSATGIILAATAHGLATNPTRAHLKLTCTSADAGYAAGQSINADAAMYDTGGDHDIQCFWYIIDATNMSIGRLASMGGSTQVWVPHATTGSWTGITDAKWSITITAEV